MSIYLGSIGCRLNQSEMESLARRLAGQGHRIVHSSAESDLCILNTCAVTGKAERKSRQAARRCHRTAPSARVLLTGCYATLLPAEAAALPGVTQVVNNTEKANLPAIVDRAACTDGQRDGRSPGEACWHLQGGRTRAYVKVQDGCNNQCAFCITTVVRGPSRSRPLADVIAEIQALEAAGYQEVVLTGVQLGSYGTDFHGPERATLQTLIERVLSETSIPRIRLSSLEPWNLNQGFFDLWWNRRLCRQLHLPLQSGSASVLRRMGRPTTPEEYHSLAASALDSIAGLALTTDIMVGFPGESDEEFEESLAFVRQSDLARLHVFGYSRRPGTAAAAMRDQVPPHVIRERSQQMRDLGRRKQQAFMARFVGRTVEVLWESAVGDGHHWSGHTDNYIRVTTVSNVALRNTLTPVQLIELQPDGMRGIARVPR